MLKTTMGYRAMRVSYHFFLDAFSYRSVWDK